MIANTLPADHTLPSPILGMGSVGKNPTFSKHGHVAYQIKGIAKCSNTVANILPVEPPTPPPPPRPWGWDQ